MVSSVVKEGATKIPITVDKATPGAEKVTFVRLLMAVVETADNDCDVSRHGEGSNQWQW